MSLVIAGRIVPLTRQTSVAPTESSSFKGKVWIGDDGRIAAVTQGADKGPDGFPAGPTVDVGSNLVLPGLIDLHSHLGYATLPLWVEPGRTDPFDHHNIWVGRANYPTEVTWPAYALIEAAPAELLAYAEIRALIGGTTSIQGSPPGNRPLDGWMIRNVEDETLGGLVDKDKVLAATLTLKAEQLGDRAEKMRNGATLFYHCAEGKRGSIVRQEYAAARTTGCLQERLVAIHTNAVESADYDAWTKSGAIVWSPFSNMWLYGETTNVPAALARNLTVCVGSDWGPSGMRNVLGELKVARLVSEANNWGLTPFDLVKMITANPGDVLTQAWSCQLGRLQPEAMGDVAVIEAQGNADPFKRLLEATEADVQLVVIGGQPLYGTSQRMTTAQAKKTSTLSVKGSARRLALTRFEGTPGVPWTYAAVLKRLNQVRKNPKAAIENARRKAYAAAEAGDPPPFRLALDMPTGLGPVGGLPKDLGVIKVPPIQPLMHDSAFFDSIKGRGFHAGLLDALKALYS